MKVDAKVINLADAAIYDDTKIHNVFFKIRTWQLPNMLKKKYRGYIDDYSK